MSRSSEAGESDLAHDKKVLAIVLPQITFEGSKSESLNQSRPFENVTFEPITMVFGLIS